MNNPLILVIIPVYNPGPHLYRCLDSIIGQTYRNLQIILIDDGSTDGSGEVCDQYAAKDDRIVVVHQPNSGVSKARNVGLEMASGDFVNFPDSDDYLELNTYEYLLEQMDAAGADAACFEYYITYPDREIKHTASDGLYGACNAEKAINELLFSGRSFLCTKLLPIGAVRNIRFIEDIYRDEDTIFCMFALHNTRKTVFLERALYHYVQSEESACRGVFRPSQLSAVKGIPINEEFLGKHYPGMVRQWRCTYMHLMVMLYCDMYFDEEDYTEEKKMIYETFRKLRKEVNGSDIVSVKNKAKFALFGFNPELFCRVHGIIHKM